MSAHNPFEAVADQDWSTQYVTENTWRNPEGAQVTMQLATFAPSKRAAMTTAQVCFMDCLRRAGLRS